MRVNRKFYIFLKIVFAVVFSTLFVMGQSKPSLKDYRDILGSSVKGVFAEGVVSDNNVVKIYNVTFDFSGNGLSPCEKNRLSTGYSISAIGENGKVYKGNIQVFSSYAWSGGDFHSWVAYFPSAIFLDNLIVSKNGKTIKQEKLHRVYGENKHIEEFNVNSNIDWKTSINTVEILVSVDKGKNWVSIPELRVPNGSIPLSKVINDINANLLILLSASDENVMYIQLLKNHAN